MMSTEERVSRLEGINEQVNERLGNMESQLNALAGRFYWLFGYLTLIWITVIVAVLFKD